MSEKTKGFQGFTVISVHLTERLWEWPGGYRDQTGFSHPPPPKQQLLRMSSRGSHSLKNMPSLSGVWTHEFQCLLPSHPPTLKHWLNPLKLNWHLMRQPTTHEFSPYQLAGRWGFRLEVRALGVSHCGYSIWMVCTVSAASCSLMSHASISWFMMKLQSTMQIYLNTHFDSDISVLLLFTLKLW